MASFRDMAVSIAPPWLRGPVGSRLLTAMATPLDAAADWTFQGVKARYPLVGTPTALAAVGRDRGIRRGPAETNQAFAARLVRWLEDWKTAGSAWTLLDQLAGYFAPAPPLMRVVWSTGTSAVWCSRAPSGARSRVVATPSNWEWDGLVKRSRCFVIIYNAAGTPYGTGGTWGTGSRTWGSGTVGTSALQADVMGVFGVVADWSAAHVLTPWVIHAFDPTSFAPTAAPGSAGMPDGTWGAWHKVVAGVAVPSRLTTARYWEIL